MSKVSPAEAREARAAWMRALARTAPIDREPLRTLPTLIEELAQRFADAPALQCASDALSFRELAAMANGYARWALMQGIQPGDVVALLMPNHSHYLPIWLGLTRAGATVALTNNHLSGDPLLHSLTIAAPTHVIVAAELGATLAELRGRLPGSLRCWTHGEPAGLFQPLQTALVQCGDEPLSSSERALPRVDDCALYLYTSGTTGLPKAARVSHYRLMQWTHWFAGMMDTQPGDRMYDCLPLYHSVGGIVATGATLLGGGSVVLRTRFSASNFWADVRNERCTLFQYIGELCRYLVNQTAGDEPIEHSLRLACGNGLRADVWTTFRDRFRIPRILEYYAGTESNVSLYNCEQRPGSIGRIPPFLTQRVGLSLLRYDPDTRAALRTGDGLCQRCAVDEPGLAVGAIPRDPARRSGRFEGYVDADATAGKVLHDVFEVGDAWYSTGDLMRRDAEGFHYFVDRIGDTFRWKGENVSTGEVQAVIARCPGVLDCLVYGVAVPGADGRAGMAALVVDATFAMATLRAIVVEQLPDYARPLFLRLTPKLASTATYKPNAQQLQADGFDPQRCSDPLYVDDRSAGAYLPIDARLFAALSTGDLRL